MDRLDAVSRYQARQRHHGLDAAPDDVWIPDAALDAARGEHVAERGVLPAGHEHRQVLLACRDEPAVGGIDIVVGLELPAANQPVQEFVREVTLALRVGGDPLVDEQAFDATHRFFFGDAGVGDTVQVTLEQVLFVGRREVAGSSESAGSACARRD